MAEETPSDARIGKTLGGKWRLDRLLGVGGMASVYAASHRNGNLAAIKILHREFARRTEARVRFLREAYIANKAGKGAVRVLDDDVDDDGSPYLVMELLHGEAVDLRAGRQGGRLPLASVLWIASETLGVLEVAHGNGITHRDLKPENLFWTDDARIKVLDFGIARLRGPGSGEQTRTGMVMGTPGYMAPEQALGRSSDIDARTDIFSVGAIMFRLLTGREVHEAGGNAVVTAATRRAPSIATVDPTLPKEVVRIVDRALAFEREARYPDARTMRVEIEELLANREEETTPIVPPPEAPAGRTEAETLGTADTVPPGALDAEETKQPGSVHAGFATQMSNVDTLALRELFETLNTALLAIVERGAAHPKAMRRFDDAYQQAEAALSIAHIGLFWNVTPHGFIARQSELLWQPAAPLPPAPARMHADGVRMMGLLPGLSRDELDILLRMLSCDIRPHADFATMLRSLKLDNLVYRVESPRAVSGVIENTDVGPTSSRRTQVSALLGSLATTEEPELRTALLDRLSRTGKGREGDIGLLIGQASVDLAVSLLRMVSGFETEASRDAIRRALKSPHAVVRIEALARLDAGGEALRVELRHALEEAPPGARIATLGDILRFKVKAAGPPLVMRVRSPAFETLSAEEQRQVLATLAELLPSRAEAMAIEMLLDQRSATAEAHESTRELAAELLGRIATSQEAAQALSAASKSHWQSSERTRAAAARALAAYAERTSPKPKEARLPTTTLRMANPARRTPSSKRPPAPKPSSDRPPPSTPKRSA